MRLCGNWPGIGRIDYLLGDYLKKDLQSGAQTIDSAREILAHFFIKGCEWINGQYIGSGDAQHYQNILLAGVDENGNEQQIKTFDPKDIDLMNPDNYALISKNLYRVQKFSSKDYCFRHHLETKVEDVKELRNITWKRIQNTQGIDGIVKVRVNHIGQIVYVGEY